MNSKWRSVAFQIWALPLFAITPFCAARTVNYQDFSSTAGLILQVNAAPANGHLRLTPAIAGKGLGGAWLETKQPVKNGFETTFQFRSRKNIHQVEMAWPLSSREAQNPAWG